MLDDPTLALAGEVLQNYRTRGLTIATAESCTGGLVAASLTHHAGSSEVVLGGYVTYSNDFKHRLLGVSLDLLARHGAVSAAVAEAMADGALSGSGASCVVAITGVAGPGGGSPEKPVGLVWFGIASAAAGTTSEQRNFLGDRAAVRRAATAHALGMLRNRAG